MEEDEQNNENEDFFSEEDQKDLKEKLKDLGYLD